MTTPGRPHADITPREVLEVAFDAEKHGYNRDQVDSFLERVAAALEDLRAQVDELSAAQAPRPAEPSASEFAPTPRLHDPDGALTRLLAIAQESADRLVHEAEVHRTRTVDEADSYAHRARSEADDYAASTKGEADRYAQRVTAEADAQAQAIRALATDEARRTAEEARQQVISELGNLEHARDQLLADREALQAHLDEQRHRLHQQLVAVQQLLDEPDFLRLHGAPATSGATAGALLASPAAGSVEPEPTAAAPRAAAPAPPPPPDIAGEAPVEVQGEIAEPAIAREEAPAAAGWLSELTGEEPAVAPAAPAEATVEDEAAGELFLDDLFPTGDQPRVDVAEGGPRWADEQRRPVDEDTRAVPALDADGGHFLAELRDVEPGEGLEPADDDTDAALTAFFDQDASDDEPSGRWRMFKK